MGDRRPSPLNGLAHAYRQRQANAVPYGKPLQDRNRRRPSRFVTRSDQSCSPLQRQTSCGSRSRSRRSYATRMGPSSPLCITDWHSAVGMFFLDASSWASVSPVFFCRISGFYLPCRSLWKNEKAIQSRRFSMRQPLSTSSPSGRRRPTAPAATIPDSSSILLPMARPREDSSTLGARHESGC